MKTTAWIAIAIAMSVLASPAATADYGLGPRNTIKKRQLSPKDRPEQGVQCDESTGKEARCMTNERSEEKHDGQER